MSTIYSPFFSLLLVRLKTFKRFVCTFLWKPGVRGATRRQIFFEQTDRTTETIIQQIDIRVIQNLYKKAIDNTVRLGNQTARNRLSEFCILITLDLYYLTVIPDFCLLFLQIENIFMHCRPPPLPTLLCVPTALQERF